MFILIDDKIGIKEENIVNKDEVKLRNISNLFPLYFLLILGSRLTTFSSQAMQFADLYSYSCLNLIYYPLCYMFRAPPMLMPHESTVPHEETAMESFKDLEDSPCGLRRRTTTGNFHLFAFLACINLSS